MRRYIKSLKTRTEESRNVMVNELDFDIVVWEIELLLRNYVYFRTDTIGIGKNLLTLPDLI